MFNQVILVGRLTRDPELRKTQSGKSVVSASLVTSKKIKVNENWEEKSEFHNLVVWFGADNFAKYLTKGSKVQVIGELQTSDWTTQEGIKRYKTEILVNQFIFLDSPKENSKPKQEEKNPFEEEYDWDKQEIEEEINVSNIPF